MVSVDHVLNIHSLRFHRNRVVCFEAYQSNHSRIMLYVNKAVFKAILYVCSKPLICHLEIEKI